MSSTMGWSCLMLEAEPPSQVHSGSSLPLQYMVSFMMSVGLAGCGWTRRWTKVGAVEEQVSSWTGKSKIECFNM